ncbi:hypothetical protein Mettu_0832 [Methylobacter tundripaludum SV96]|uniref:DUF2971 family protein n=2 Tax=Methylobacter tundripaludum TaxID=173365 RepID=G3IQF1_METTV|nr:hypothetical protein Mettu_0832 [Methylobacter tundripaludum SV96]
MWASLATALEDQSEMRYALTRATQLIESGQIEGDASFLGDIVPCLNSATSPTAAILGLKTYVTSFRTNTDASTHWKTYASAGTGFALAFNPKLLEIPGTLLHPVIYDIEEQDKLLRAFIESTDLLFKRISVLGHNNDTAFRLRQRAIHWTALGLWTLAPLVKEHRFREENEWRLIVIEPVSAEVKNGEGISQEVRLRSSNGRDIPYKVLGYNPLPVVELELGKHTAVALDDLGLKEQLQHATSSSDVSITRSVVCPKKSRRPE